MTKNLSITEQEAILRLDLSEAQIIHTLISDQNYLETRDGFEHIPAVLAKIQTRLEVQIPSLGARGEEPRVESA